MASDAADETVYYVISDLHIGGDEQLEQVEFLDELLTFLRRLERIEDDVELIINGDAFGLWEFTELDGLEKFDALVDRYPELFEQFQRTGESIQITLVPGNHDHELAAYEEYVDRFDDYNVTLEQREALTRPIGDDTIWFEHGHQRDPNNRFEDFGNPHDKPLGYYYNTLVTSRAGRISGLGRKNWLKDIQAVTPTERVPIWLLSKYFYHEMHPVLRYAAVPFLLLFNISIVLAALVGLDLLGIWSTPTRIAEIVLSHLGPVGTILYVLFMVNLTIAGVLVLVWIPGHIVLRDFKQSLDRFELVETEFSVDPNKPYQAAARELFARRPDIAIFCYGHTHRPMITRLERGVLVNTGSWLKRFHRRRVLAGVLPPIFHPSFRLSIVKISTEPEGIVVEHETIDKDDPTKEDLTLTERLLTVGRKPEPEIPDRVVIEQTRESTQR